MVYILEVPNLKEINVDKVSISTTEAVQRSGPVGLGCSTHN